MAKFVSRRGEFRLIIRPTDRTIDEARRPVTIPGERVEFHNHIFVTKDEGLINYLKRHPLFKREYDIAEADGGKASLSVPNKGDMLKGASSTADSLLPDVRVSLRPLDQEVAPAEVVMAASEPPITRDEIKGMIGAQFDDFFGQIKTLLQNQNKAPEAPSVPKPKPKPIENETKAKRTFTCRECGQTGFKSGMAVGIHKQEVHK